MRRVALPGSDVSSSVLGFGCASLMAHTGMDESVRLLEEALDAGVTHFDVARSYGYGEAEAAVGRFAAGHRRDDLTIVTKLGIAPPRRSAGLAAAKAAVRRVGGQVPAVRRAARARASRMVKHGRFSVEEARSSLETSLRELGMDHVDVLLLHECEPEDVTDDLVAFLEARVAAGVVRCLGVATTQRAAARLVTNWPAATRLVQVPSSVIAPAFDTVPGLRERTVITHSPMGTTVEAIHRHVAERPEVAERWSAVLGANCTDRRVLARILLAGAMTENPHGVTLFASRTSANIRANAALGVSPVDPRAYHELRRLVAAEEALRAVGPSDGQR